MSSSKLYFINKRKCSELSLRIYMYIYIYKYICAGYGKQSPLSELSLRRYIYINIFVQDMENNLLYLNLV